MSRTLLVSEIRYFKVLHIFILDYIQFFILCYSHASSFVNIFLSAFVYVTSFVFNITVTLSSDFIYFCQFLNMRLLYEFLNTK